MCADEGEVVSSRIKVSIIIPYTSRDALYERAVASVRHALERAPEVDGEVLPIDDHARTGVSAARNRGLAQAQGDWVVFVDADDELGEDFFPRAFLPHASDPAVDLIVTDHVEVRPQGEGESGGADAGLRGEDRSAGESPNAETSVVSGHVEVRPQGEGGDDGSGLRGNDGSDGKSPSTVTSVVSGHVEVRPQGESGSGIDGPGLRGEASRQALYKGNHYIERRILHRDSHVWGKAFRREAIGELRFDESLTIGEDMLFLLDLVLRIAERGKRVAASGVVGYRYRINPAGAMERPFTPSFLDELRCWRMAQERLMPHAREFTAYAFPALGAIRIRSALMVAQRVACAARRNAEAGVVSGDSPASGGADAEAGLKAGAGADAGADSQAGAGADAGMNSRACDAEALADADRLCREAFREAMHMQGAFAALSMYDKCRAMLYDFSPRLYLKVYCARKAT